MARTPQKKDAALAKSIGSTLARFRQERELTQEAVAERLGIGLEAVSRLERGIVMPTVERLTELAEVFNCRTADLLTSGSTRCEDQAAELLQLLSGLNEEDREFVVDMVRRLTERLSAGTESSV